MTLVRSRGPAVRSPAGLRGPLSGYVAVKAGVVGTAFRRGAQLLTRAPKSAYNVEYRSTSGFRWVTCGTVRRNLLLLLRGRPRSSLSRLESEVSPMNRRNLPPGWRQPPETTAEPVPLRRPYMPPDVFPVTPPPPRSQPRPRPAAAPGQAPASARPASPAPASPAPAGIASPPPPQRQPAMRRWRPMRAIIGDDIRTPMLWCEFGGCIARYTSEQANSERDLRARALAAGWCYDVFGRLACPRCTRNDPSFRGVRPPAPEGQDPSLRVGRPPAPEGRDARPRRFRRR